MNQAKQDRFDNLKVGQKVMTPDGSGTVNSFANNAMGQSGIVVKFKDGSMKGLYTVHNTITANKYP